MKILALAYLVLMAGASTDTPREHARADAKPDAALAATDKDDKDDDSGASMPRELICHKGRKTLELPQSAVRAHLGHGDQRGACAVQAGPADIKAPENGKDGT
jgi:hypothetical protein